VNIDNINKNIKEMEYAVRGPLVFRAFEIEKELEQVSSSKPTYVYSKTMLEVKDSSSG